MKWRWVMVLLLLTSIPMTAYAKDAKGYIRVKMAYDGRPVAGGTVTLYDVSDSPEEVNSLEMLVYVKELGIPGFEKQVSESGLVEFDGLAAGRYFLVQQKAPAGYYPIKPFLVEIPLTAGETLIGGIEAAPKLEPEKKLPQTGQLIWPAWALLGTGVCVVGIGLVFRQRE